MHFSLDLWAKFQLPDIFIWGKTTCSCFFHLTLLSTSNPFLVFSWCWDRRQAELPWCTDRLSIWRVLLANNQFQPTTPQTHKAVGHFSATSGETSNLSKRWENTTLEANDKILGTPFWQPTEAHVQQPTNWSGKKTILASVVIDLAIPPYSRGSVCFPASQMSSQRRLHSSPANRPHVESAWKINQTCK